MNELVEAQRVEQDIRQRSSAYDETDAPAATTAPRFVIFSFLFTFSAVCLHFIPQGLLLKISTPRDLTHIGNKKKVDGHPKLSPSTTVG